MKSSQITVALAALLFTPFSGAAEKPKEFNGATPLQWSVRMADSEISRLGDRLAWREGRKTKWDYTAGLFTLSLLKLNEKVPTPAYVEFTKDAIGSFIGEDGSIQGYKAEDYNIDNVAPGKTVLALYEITREERYKKCADLLRKQLNEHPRTSQGGFWHKQRYPWQMWLDGLFMGAPFYAEYTVDFKGPAADLDDVVKQFRLVDEHLYDAKSGLYWHGWDEKREQEWADKSTGLSANFWGRAVGWWIMAQVDVLDFLPQDHPGRKEIIALIKKTSDGIVKHQDPASGVWWQVLDQGGRKGNYLEATASSMFVYSMAKAVNHGYLSEDYLPAILRGYNGIIKEFIKTDDRGKISLTRCCSVAGLGYGRDGSYAYYLREPIVDNDLKGVGPLILAGIELQKLLDLPMTVKIQSKPTDAALPSMPKEMAGAIISAPAVKPAPSVDGILDAMSLTGASTPLQIAQYGTRNLSAPVLVGKLHDPANYKAAPKLPEWQFASKDPTGGVLSFERQPAPADGWHTFSRKGKVVVSGGSSAKTDRVYTVFNAQQLIAAIKEAVNDPKIIRIVGHIDFRWSENNTKFQEYTSYSDQKFGGTISIPSNTTLVGINDAQGRPARITGTSLQIGNELALTPDGDAETDFKQWVASGKNPEEYPTWTRNVIIRNLAIDTPWDVNPEGPGDAYADGMTIARAQNIWIDHVSITDGDTPDSMATDTRHDGALDVVRGSDYVTVANCYFSKHHKVTLVGNGDAGRAWSDAGQLHVTFSGNWWDNVGARLPLNRFGQVHVYNNVVTGNTATKDKDMKFNSALNARFQSNMLVQNNYYQFTGLKPREFCGKVISGKDYLGFRSSGHQFISDKADNGAWLGGAIDIDGMCGMTPPGAADAWTPPYAHILKTAGEANTSVRANAGAGKLR